MTREEIDDNLPILEVYFEETLAALERRAAGSSRVKASRRLLIETYMATRSLRETASTCGVSVSAVRQVMAAAIYRARRLAGLWPPPSLPE